MNLSLFTKYWQNNGIRNKHFSSEKECGAKEDKKGIFFSRSHAVVYDVSSREIRFQLFNNVDTKKLFQFTLRHRNKTNRNCFRHVDNNRNWSFFLRVFSKLIKKFLITFSWKCFWSNTSGGEWPSWYTEGADSSGESDEIQFCWSSFQLLKSGVPHTHSRCSETGPR